MTLTLQQIQELPIRERRQSYSNSEINYFLTQEYRRHKQRKQVMIARTMAELEIDYDRNDRISSLQ
jgi:hypothetical protein